MKNIGDILPQAEKLEGAATDKNELIGKVLEIKNFAILSSSYEGQDEFAIVQANCDGKLVTFAAGQVIKDKLQTITKGGLPVRAKLVLTKSKKGRGYFDLTNP